MNEVDRQVQELQRKKELEDKGEVGVEVEAPKKEEEKTEFDFSPKQQEVSEPEPPIKQEAEETETPVEETPKNEEQDKIKYSKAVQKRIDEYAYQLGESRRREEEAIQIAQAIKKERDDIKQKLQTVNSGYVNEFGGRIDNSMEAAKAKLKKAMEDQDYEAVAEAQLQIGKLGAEQDRYTAMKAEQDRLSKQPVQEEKEIPQAPKQPMKDQKAEEWATKNEWFGRDRVMTNVAYAVHEELVNSGVDPRSDYYYTEIDKRMRENLPHKFNDPSSQEEVSTQQQPVQTVASANRNRGTGRNVVKLSSAELHMAKRLNLSPEQYAKEKLKLQSRR